jgi:hypothetical protein
MNSTTTEDFDDSWVKPQHKKELLITIKQIYNTSYTWADDILIKCLVKEHYKTTIKNMNKEEYLKDLEEEDDTETMLHNMF